MSTVVNVVITEEDGWFVASNPDTGVVSQGETIDAATANLKEALELYLEDTNSRKQYFNQRSFLTTFTL